MAFLQLPSSALALAAGMKDKARTLLCRNATKGISEFQTQSFEPTHFQKVGLNAMLAADTVAWSVVASTGEGLISCTHSTS